MLLVRFFLVLACVFAVPALANVYIGNVTIAGVPIYFGATPFITYGNITGIVTTGNATNARGNIVLCDTFDGTPLETALLWCLQNAPAAIISVFPPISTQREVYLGRSMYTDYSIPYYNVPEGLRQAHILEIDVADYGTLAVLIGTLVPVTVDGSTPNQWLEMYEGALGEVYQILDSVAAGVTAIFDLLVLFYLWRATLLRNELKTYVLVIGFLSCVIRCLYNATSPTGLRRMLLGPDDFIFNTLVLMAAQISTALQALFWLEIVHTKDLRIATFLRNRWLRAALYTICALWVLYLVVDRILMNFPSVSPIGTGLSMEALIIIQDSLLGILVLVYGYAAVALLVKMRKLRSRTWKQRLGDVFLLASQNLLLLFLTVVTAIAFTPLWQEPLVPGATQILCSLFQTFLHLLQAIAIYRSTEWNGAPTPKSTNGSGNTRKNSVATLKHATDVTSDVEKVAQTGTEETTTDGEEEEEEDEAGSETEEGTEFEPGTRV